MGARIKKKRKKTRRQKIAEKERLADELNKMPTPKSNKVGVTTTRYAT